MILYYYLPQTKLREGNAFTPVCHSVHGGVVLPNREPPGLRPYFLTETPPLTRDPSFYGNERAARSNLLPVVISHRVMAGDYRSLLLAPC